MKLKLLHAADIHLDSPFSGLDSRSAEARRGELRSAFTAMMTYAAKADTDLVLLSGDLFDGDGTKRVVAHFVKQDDTNVTQDEFNAYGTNLYNLTKSIAQDGKNIYGFISADNLEGALKEKPLEKCIGKNEYDVDIIMTSWEFRIDDVFYNCSLSLGTDRSSDLEYIDVTIDKSLQKSLNESMEEADKALEQLGY